MTVTAENLAKYLVENFNLSPDEIGPDTPLVSSGLLDSFDVVKLVAHLESEARVRVNEAEITLDNLNSISKILNYLERKRQEA